MKIIRILRGRADSGKRRAPALHRSRAALWRSRCQAGGLSSRRDAGAKRDGLRRWIVRSELLVRIFRRSADDVAASERGGKRSAFWNAASPHGHGHHYRARLTFRQDASESSGGTGAVPSVFRNSDATAGVPPAHAEIARILESLRAELDHKNLNQEVPGLTNRPKTTESLAQYIHARVAAVLPIHRVRLHEREDFFAEYWNGGSYFLALQRSFSAAHRLHARGLSAAENVALYGKCNNPRGHGHYYLTEATVGGAFDERSGALYDFVSLRDGIDRALQPWQDKHLDLETDEFREIPSTGENIVRSLWPKVNARLEDRLTRLRLWETPNNRFTLRR